jgi:protein SCO1/2
MKRVACLSWPGCALSLLLLTPALAAPPVQQVNRAAAGWPLGAFTLAGPHGAPFTQENLHGRWTLLLLEDGDCGAPCEAALTALAGLFRRISQTQAIKTVQVVLVLPESHGGPPERLGPYLARFDPRFVGAEGSRTTLQGLADDLGGVVAPRSADKALSGNTSRSGAGSIWVIGPDGILRAELLPPFDVLQLTAEFMKTRARR